MLLVQCFNSGILANYTSVNTQDEANKYVSAQKFVDGDGWTFTITDVGNAPIWDKVRKQRNALLAACDFAVMSDYPINSDIKTLLLTYRQELRDLPKSGQDPNNVTWPVMPSLK